MKGNRNSKSQTKLKIYAKDSRNESNQNTRYNASDNDSQIFNREEALENKRQYSERVRDNCFIRSLQNSYRERMSNYISADNMYNTSYSRFGITPSAKSTSRSAFFRISKNKSKPQLNDDKLKGK